MSSGDGPIYPGGFGKLMTFLERRQRPFLGAADFLPAPDVDLAALWDAEVFAPTDDPDRFLNVDIHRKSLDLQNEFQGQPQLLHLHAVLIAILRRADPPEDAVQLFLRIWREEGERIAKALRVRWLISTATTFADWGETGDQRALGMGLSLLFDMIKLHDTERRATGIAGDTPSPLVPTKGVPPLAFRMAPYSIQNGDLDKIVLARLWKLANRDATIKPLAVRMLRLVMSDQRTVFARMQAYKKTP